MVENTKIQSVALRFPKIDRQALVHKWGRRLLTIPLYHLAFAVLLALFPLLLLIAGTIDLARHSRGALVRFTAFGLMYFGMEIIAVWAFFFIWLLTGAVQRRNQARYMRWNYAVQHWATKYLFKIPFWLFKLRLAIDAEDPLYYRTPFNFFVRHVSFPDVIIPSSLTIMPHHTKMRYIMKRELLWDPGLDIGGNRIPNYFTRRGSADSERELAAIRRLAKGIIPNEGMMIFPEGTRFTPQKREHILKKLAEKGETYLLEKARRLRHLLPPRLGGSLTLLEANPNVDAVFCAHSGFERITKAHELINGNIIGETIDVHVWRVPAAEIPKERQALIEWLYQQWYRMDDWIERKLKERKARNGKTPDN